MTGSFTVLFVVQGHLDHCWLDMTHYFDETAARTYLRNAVKLAQNKQSHLTHSDSFRIIKRIEEVLP